MFTLTKENIAEIMDSEKMAEWVCNVGTNAYGGGCCYQLYLDLHDHTLVVNYEVSSNSWLQRDDGSLTKIAQYENLCGDICEPYDGWEQWYREELEIDLYKLAKELATINSQPIKMFNGTAHDVNIVSGAELDSADRKFKGGAIVHVIPKGDTMLNVKFGTVEVVDNLNSIIPVYEKTIEAVDDLPDGYDVYVVSALYASAYMRRHPEETRLYGVADPVMSADGKTFVGCRGLQRF